MTDNNHKNILETRDVKLWYGHAEALHGINLDFPEKELPHLLVPQALVSQLTCVR